MLTTRPSSPEASTKTTVAAPAQSIDATLLAIRTRIRALVEIAAANASTISLNELRVLLPASRFPTDAALERFLSTDERLSIRLSAIGGEVTLRGREDLASERRFQRDLTKERLAKANHFLRNFAKKFPWIELAGVSGSIAYGGAKPGDDIDFFLVTREGRLWISLLLAMVAARLERLRLRDAPVYCFNRIIERPACERAFRENREPLFAREALNLVVLRGRDLYGRLLASASWMEKHFRELYAARLKAASKLSAGSRAGNHFAGSVLNAGAFLGLGPYLWLMGVARNVRLRKQGRDKECFRTIIKSDFYATESTIYDELREEYRRVFA